MNKYTQQVKKDHYATEGYITNERWNSYFWQFDLIRKIARELGKENLNILEIGVGNGIVESTLTKFGHTVTTMDVASDLNPDILLDLPNVPSGVVYDLILCCEVLEHMRYSDSIKSLAAMRKISRRVIFSIPDRTLYFSLSLKIPLLESKGIVITFPFHKMPFKRGGEHYWEIGVDGISSRGIKNSVLKLGYSVVKDFRIKQNPWHHFFLVNYEK